MNDPRGRPRVTQPRDVPSAASGKEAGMASRDQPGGGWTVVLRRHPTTYHQQGMMMDAG